MTRQNVGVLVYSAATEFAGTAVTSIRQKVEISSVVNIFHYTVIQLKLFIEKIVVVFFFFTEKLFFMTRRRYNAVVRIE